jgi:ABC-type molybdate transport system ATPase subunit
VGVENRLPGVVEECEKDLSTIRVGQNKLKVQGKFQPGVKVVVCLRPEEIAVSRENSHASNSTALMGTITGVSSSVLHQRITLDCGGVEIVALLERKVGYGLGLAEGDVVTVSYSFNAAHLIVNQG